MIQANPSLTQPVKRAHSILSFFTRMQLEMLQLQRDSHIFMNHDHERHPIGKLVNGLNLKAKMDTR